MKRILLIVFIVCSIQSFGQGFFWTFVGVGYPSVTTNSATIIRRYTATIGGEVTSSNNLTVTDRGVCWSVSLNPTISDSHAHVGSGVGAFTYDLTSLNENTTYHFRAFAVNSTGTMYGQDLTFNTDPNPCTSSIGTSYGGGKIGYFLQAGDTGYDPNICHGLIYYEIAGYAQWGCINTHIDTFYGFGYGQSNTTAILAACSTSGIAAKLCDDLTQDGYTDWYLPSQNELLKITYYTNFVGKPLPQYYYWSSTQYDSRYAYTSYNNSSESTSLKNNSSSIKVVAVRSF